MNLINSLSMGSQEIANEAGKRHDQVLRDIRNMLKGLDLPVPDFDTTKVCYLENQQVTATFCKTTKRVREIFLPKDLTLTLVSGWDVKMRLAVIRRWQELEEALKTNAMLVESFQQTYLGFQGRFRHPSISVH